MAESRGLRMLQRIKDDRVLEFLNSVPKHDSTKGTSAKERNKIWEGDPFIIKDAAETKATTEKPASSENVVKVRKNYRTLSNVGFSYFNDPKSQDSVPYYANDDPDTDSIINTLVQFESLDSRNETTKSASLERTPLLGEQKCVSPKVYTTLRNVNYSCISHPNLSDCIDSSTALCDNIIDNNMPTNEDQIDCDALHLDKCLISDTESDIDSDGSDFDWSEHKSSNDDSNSHDEDLKSPVLDIFEFNENAAQLETAAGNSSVYPATDIPENVPYSSTDYNNTNDKNHLLEQSTDKCLVNEMLTGITDMGIVMPKPKQVNNRRVYDKQQACFYCKKLFSKLPQHLAIAHAEKKEVADFLQLPKNGRERSEQIRKLRNRGNYVHNLEVLKKKEGSLIVARRTSNDVSYTAYLPCEYCYAFFHKRKLWRHVRSCPDKFEKTNTNRKSVISNAFLMLPLNPSASDLFQSTILKDMQDGPEKAIIRSDPTLCIFGSREALKHKHLPQQKNHISFKLRLMARLILQLKQSGTSVLTTAQCVLAENFDLVSKTVVNISLDIDKPSIGQKLGHHLKKCAKIVRNRCIVEKNEIVRKKVEDFLVLYEDEWEEKVSKPAKDILDRRRYNKTDELPSTEDLMKLNKYILKKEEEFMNSDFKDIRYTDVAKIVLSHTIVFNRRRVGEMSLMELESFKNRVQNTKPQGEIGKLLSKSETQMFADLEIVYLRGKKGAKVDCLLTPNMVKCIDYLVENRASNGILPDNIYLFCLPYSKHCMRGHDALRDTAKNCGAEIPSKLKSTNLRKHISTVSQLLNLSESDFNALCKHLGHNPKVHREYYQMPEEVILKTQISKILLTLQEGSLMNQRGKRLSELEVKVNSNQVGDPGKSFTPDIANHSHDFDYSYSPSSKHENDFEDIPKPTNKSQKRRQPQQNIRKKSQRTIWSKEEINILKEFFTEEILIGSRPPTKKRCEDCIKQFPIFLNRGGYLKIKWRVNSLIQEDNKMKAGAIKDKC